MLISVDLPAPFSPMIPVIDAVLDVIDTSAIGVHRPERLVDRFQLDRWRSRRFRVVIGAAAGRS